MKKRLVDAIGKGNRLLIHVETVIMVISLVLILILFAARILLSMVFKIYLHWDVLLPDTLSSMCMLI